MDLGGSGNGGNLALKALVDNKNFLLLVYSVAVIKIKPRLLKLSIKCVYQQ